MKHLLVIGGGAAGLAAAIAAARQPGLQVTVLERMDRVGKKILATGNGRCNLTNMQASFSHFYSRDPSVLKRALSGMEPQQVLDFFESLGLMCQEEDEGRVYPYCKQASMVMDILLQALDVRGIGVECGAAVNRIERSKGGFCAYTGDGRKFTADRVILTAGGKASPKLGSDGSGYTLAKQLGHSCTALAPALVAMKCDMAHVGGLKGIRAECGLTLLAGTHVLGREKGEVQFTEYGLSGIPVMQLSGRLTALRKGENCTALVDLFPDLEQAQVFSMLQQRQKTQNTLEDLLLGTVHKRLAYAALKGAGLSPLSRPVASLKKAELLHLAEVLKAWPFRVLGTQGWDNAQITAGGVPLGEISPDTMESNVCPGLYLAGELLDVAGDCGGFNLHWAWCSGMRAGLAAAKAVLK